MNVLTSILEWIEQEPARASRFVLALADELSLLTRASAHALIPIELELELCRAHVALMSQRLEVEVSLSVSGIDPAEQVPPAVFHTLIENAMTHGCFAEGPVRITLDAARAGARRRYRFVSPEVAPLPASREGTGSRYLRARLQVAFDLPFLAVLRDARVRRVQATRAGNLDGPTRRSLEQTDRLGPVSAHAR
jgi:LytS/YehU family sensor histidine kinase